MILAAGYLLYMYGRVVFGELSDFLAGLGDHLTDMTPVEILTLVPLGTLVVIFGIQPGLLLDLVSGTVDRDPRRGPAVGADRDPDRGRGRARSAILVVLVLARIGWVLLGPGRPPSSPRAGPPIELAGLRPRSAR